MTLKPPSTQSYSKRLEAWVAGTIAAVQVTLVAVGLWWFW